MTDMPEKGYTFGGPPADEPRASLPPFTFSLGSRQPDYTAVTVDELSASLGLPSANQRVMLQESPVRSHKSRTSPGVPGVRQGKLIDRALAKPLTANTLAHILSNQSESSKDSTATACDISHSKLDIVTSAREGRTNLKVVRPPPGFANEMPRMVSVEQDLPIAPTITPQSGVAPLDPPGYHHHQRPMVEAITPFQQHARRPSSRRHPRRHTRPKRTDQGPEPSAADIYPDDANWTARQAVQQNYFDPPPYSPQFQRLPQPELQVENPTSWPTPAEVYMADTTKSQAAHPAQQSNLVETHRPPSTDDLTAADDDVHTLLGDLPAPSITTLIHFGSLDLLAEDHPLSPRQESGERYGLRYYGLGLGDDWELAPFHSGESYDRPEEFKVRPRNHEGWGGYYWAYGRGWANAELGFP
jgi:hypothetical protein